MSTIQRAVERCEILLLESAFGQHMLATYRRLPDRDQCLVRILAVAVGVALVMVLILAPAGRYAVDGMQAYRRANADYHWLLAHQQQAEQIGASRRAVAELGDLQPTLLASAKANELAVSRFEGLNSGGLRVWLQDARFAEVMAWLDRLRLQHYLHVSTLEAKGGDGADNSVQVRVDIAP